MFVLFSQHNRQFNNFSKDKKMYEDKLWIRVNIFQKHESDVFYPLRDRNKDTYSK